MEKRTVLHLAFVGLLLSITACGNQKQKQDQEAQDAEYRAQIEAKTAAEEAARKVADSLCFNLWDGLKFGMTVQEVSQTKIFGTLKGNDAFYEVDAKQLSKTFGTKLLKKATLNFNNDGRRLESIVFDSPDGLTEDRLEDMVNDCRLIVAKVESCFQTKFQWEKESISKADFKDNKIVRLIGADYGNSSVLVNFSETYDGGQFDYDVVVSYNSSFE